MSNWKYSEESFQLRGIISFRQVLTDTKLRIGILLDKDNHTIVSADLNKHSEANVRTQNTLGLIVEICNEDVLKALKNHPQYLHTLSFKLDSEKLKCRDLSGNDLDMFTLKNGDEIFINCKSGSGIVIDPNTNTKIGHRTMVFVNDLTLISVKKIDLPYRDIGSSNDNGEYLEQLKKIQEEKIEINIQCIYTKYIINNISYNAITTKI